MRTLILRTVMSKLQQEIFRRGYYWEKKFRLSVIHAMRTIIMMWTCAIVWPGQTTNA